MTGSVDSGSHSNQVYADCVDLSAIENASKKQLGLADETDDVLGRLHGLGGDGAGTVGALDQDRIDVAGVGHQPLHFGGDRRKLGDAEFDQCVLEIGKLT